MHIEAGVVLGAKIILNYATAAGVVGMTAKLAVDNIKENGILSQCNLVFDKKLTKCSAQ